MAKIETKADINTILQVRIANEQTGWSIQFKIDDKNGKDAQVSFDGGESWYPAWVAYHSIKAFSERYPFAFEEE